MNYCIIVFMIVVPAVAYWKKALNLAASIAAFFMIAVAFIAGANYAFFLITAFLLISVIEKVFHAVQHDANENITQKIGTRDLVQVFVNGGVSTVCVLLWFFSSNDIFLICFASSLIESFGDSVASDIGIASKQQAYDICRFKKITTGLSGGITLAGTFGCLVACVLLSCIAYVFQIVSTLPKVFILVIASFGGCIVDSILGSLIQRKNKCLVCGRITEKNIHCCQKTAFYSGIKLINNDVVNLLCNVFSSIAILLLIG